MPLFRPEPSDPRCRVKICGLVSAEDARRCAGLGADAVGFNFWAGSRRFVAPSEAALWLRDLPAHPLRVGVFVDAEPGEILALLRSGSIDAAQLHGGESPESCRRILDSGFPVIKAIGLRDRRSMSDIEPFLNGSVSALLLDAYAPGLYGGTGQTVDWSLASEVAAMCAGLPVILAGGLNPENVAQAIAAVRPHAVDVASGVETQPGCKDWDAVRNFILRAHSALPSPGPVAN